MKYSFGSIKEFELFVYEIANKYPEIKNSRLVFKRLGQLLEN